VLVLGWPRTGGLEQCRLLGMQTLAGRPNQLVVEAGLWLGSPGQVRWLAGVQRTEVQLAGGGVQRAEVQLTGGGHDLEQGVAGQQ
jgi:hypothetical protein